MARHIYGTITLVLLPLFIVGCKSGADAPPLRLETLLSRQTKSSQASASVNPPSLPSSGSTQLSSQSPASSDYRVPKPFSATGSTMEGVRGTFQQTATSIKDAMTIQPKVIPAQDPTSLSFDPGPLQPDLYVSAAAVLEQQRRTADAVSHYQQALSVDPNHRAALIGLARLQHRSGDVDAAIQVYQTALKAHPDDAVLLNDLGLCYARSGQSDNALAVLQRAIELEPKSTLYRNNMAAVLVEAGRSGDAVPMLAQTYGTAVAYYNVGYLLQQRGEVDAAVEHFTAALEANPSLTPARSMLDQLTPQLGRRPTGPPSPDRSRLPSAAVTPLSPPPQGPIGHRADAPMTSPATWSALANEAGSPNVIRAVATDISAGRVSAASHVATPPTIESVPGPLDSAAGSSNAPDLLNPRVPATLPQNTGRLVPPVPQPVTREVQAGFLPTPEPSHPE